MNTSPQASVTLSTSPFFITIKRITNVPEIQKLVEQFLSHVGLRSGRNTLCVTERLRPAGLKEPHVRVKRMTDFGVVLSVRFSTENDSHYSALLSRDGVTPTQLYTLLTAGLDGRDCFIPGKEKPASVVQFPQEKQTCLVEKPVVAVVTPVEIPVRPEVVSAPIEAPHSLVGFTKNDLNVDLLVIAIYEKHGKGEITSERFHAIMRDEKFCDAEESNKSIGRIMGFLTTHDYMLSRVSNKIHFFRLSEKALKIVVVEKPQETPPVIVAAQPAPVVIPASTALMPIAPVGALDPGRITQKIAELNEMVAQLGSARKRQAGVDHDIEVVESEMAQIVSETMAVARELERLKVLDREATTRREALLDELKALDLVVSDPKFVGAEAKLQALSELMG